jgi:hypothetical protein
VGGVVEELNRWRGRIEMQPQAVLVVPRSARPLMATTGAVPERALRWAIQACTMALVRPSTCPTRA